MQDKMDGGRSASANLCWSPGSWPSHYDRCVFSVYSVMVLTKICIFGPVQIKCNMLQTSFRETGDSTYSYYTVLRLPELHPWLLLSCCTSCHTGQGLNPTWYYIMSVLISYFKFEQEHVRMRQYSNISPHALMGGLSSREKMNPTESPNFQ